MALSLDTRTHHGKHSPELRAFNRLRRCLSCAAA